MNFVQPIRDLEKIDAMKAYLKNKRERDYMLFLVGISIGLRISDILQLRKEDALKSHIDIKEKKTRKHKRVKVPPFIKRELVAYANALHDGDYFFPSRQGGIARQRTEYCERRQMHAMRRRLARIRCVKHSTTFLPANKRHRDTTGVVQSYRPGNNTTIHWN